MSNQNYTPNIRQQIFPGVGLGNSNSYRSPTLDNLVLSTLGITDLLTVNNLNVTGNFSYTNIFAQVTVETDEIKELNAGQNVKMLNTLVFTGVNTHARFQVFDTSGTIVGGFADIGGYDTTISNMLPTINGTTGGFTWSNSAARLMNLVSAGSLGQLNTDILGPLNPVSGLLLNNIVVSSSGSNISGALRAIGSQLQIYDTLSSSWINVGSSYIAGTGINFSGVGNNVINVNSTQTFASADITTLNTNSINRISGQGVFIDRPVVGTGQSTVSGALSMISNVLNYYNGSAWVPITGGSGVTAGTNISITGANTVNTILSPIFTRVLADSTADPNGFISGYNLNGTTNIALRYESPFSGGDTVKLVFGRDNATYGEAVIKHNFVSGTDPNNSLQLGLSANENIVSIYGGGYTKVTNLVLRGLGQAESGGLRMNGTLLSYHNGTIWNDLVRLVAGAIDNAAYSSPTNIITMAPPSLNTMSLRVTNDATGPTAAISLTSDSAANNFIDFNGTASNYFRSRINGTNFTNYITVSNNGALHDYVAFGPNTMNVLGSMYYLSDQFYVRRTGGVYRLPFINDSINTFELSSTSYPFHATTIYTSASPSNGDTINQYVGYGGGSYQRYIQKFQAVGAGGSSSNYASIALQGGIGELRVSGLSASLINQKITEATTLEKGVISLTDVTENLSIVRTGSTGALLRTTIPTIMKAQVQLYADGSSNIGMAVQFNDGFYNIVMQTGTGGRLEIYMERKEPVNCVIMAQIVSTNGVSAGNLSAIVQNDTTGNVPLPPTNVNRYELFPYNTSFYNLLNPSASLFVNIMMM